MPGAGKAVYRDYSAAEQSCWAPIADRFEISPETMSSLIGGGTVDVFLNDVAYWANVPKAVWEYVLGGYLVLKKWLSYREIELTGVPLTQGDLNTFVDTTARISGIVLLASKLDANYSKVMLDAFKW